MRLARRRFVQLRLGRRMPFLRQRQVRRRRGRRTGRDVVPATGCDLVLWSCGTLAVRESEEETQLLEGVRPWGSRFWRAGEGGGEAELRATGTEETGDHCEGFDRRASRWRENNRQRAEANRAASHNPSPRPFPGKTYRSSIVNHEELNRIANFVGKYRRGRESSKGGREGGEGRVMGMRMNRALRGSTAEGTMSASAPMV